MINGKGIRVSLFVSGCTHRCKGCFNRDYFRNIIMEILLQKKEEEEIFLYFKKYGKAAKGLSLLGGDPTYCKKCRTTHRVFKKI